MKKLLMVYLLVVSFSRAQTTSPVHPSAAETADALHTMSVTLSQANTSAVSLMTQLYGSQIGHGFRMRVSALQDITDKWGSVMTVSNGTEKPSAADLFFIYTELQDFLSTVDDLSQEDKVAKLSRESVLSAAALVRVTLPLLRVREVVRYATADQIDRLSTCASTQKRKH